MKLQSNLNRNKKRLCFFLILLFFLSIVITTLRYVNLLLAKKYEYWKYEWIYDEITFNKNIQDKIYINNWILTISILLFFLCICIIIKNRHKE
jgi:hypothetical protein